MYLVIQGNMSDGMQFFGPFSTKGEAEVYAEEHGCVAVVPFQETFDFPEMSGKGMKRFYRDDGKDVYLDVTVAEVNYDLGITIMRGKEKSLCLNRKLYGPKGSLGSYQDYAQKFWQTLKVLQSSPVIQKGVMSKIYKSGDKGRVTVACAYSGE